MKNIIKQSSLIAALVLSANLLSLAQAGAKLVVDERNVRAQMNFLAGDAMQGRGSGTIFERIAAEYVGSQFMQFGLEPAGENGWDGKPSYVQTISNSRYFFEANPALTISDMVLEHGNEMLVQRVSSGSLSGPLQKIELGAKPAANAAVFVKMPPNTSQNLLQELQSVIAAGPSIVIVEETPGHRERWATLAARRLSYLVTSQTARPSALVIVSKNAAAKITALPDGSNVELSGKTASAELQQTWNAIGKITGTDPKLASEVIVLSSHLDHTGVQPNVSGNDKIFNGADDDASGTVAVLELARALAAGKKPQRTIYFVSFGSEEAGGHGSRYFVENLPFPKEKLIANLQFEMIGRPDAKVKPEELWLTGYERSNLGPELAKRGAKLVQDPHPTQNFFQRSDNYTLARQGIIAHTVSSFGLHMDYHRPSDELKTIDFVHMTRSINSMIKPVEWLVNSDFRPVWNEGMRP